MLANHLKDLQLVLIVTRGAGFSIDFNRFQLISHVFNSCARHPEVRKSILKTYLDDNADPWLRFLLAYHSGDTALCQSIAQAPVAAAERSLFDDSLRLCAHVDGLATVGELLR